MQKRDARTRPARLSPYAGLAGGGLGDIGDTGIPAIDAVVAVAQQKLDRLVLATEIGTAAAIIGAAIGVMLLFGGGPRR